MEQNIKDGKQRVWMVLLPICVLLFIYIVLRALHLSFTHDESSTYGLVTDKDYLSYTANNHLLNTWLSAICRTLFGESEFSLRLPNVLIFSVYLFFCCRLIKESKRMAYVFFAVPLLFLNPFVLDFFSLSRGYGLCVGFTIASLYYLLRGNFKEYTFNSFLKDFVPGMLFATLALFSNLSLVNFYISLLLLFLIQYILLCKKGQVAASGRQILIFSLICVAAGFPLAFILKRLLFLSAANDLYVGSGSMDECISSLMERSSYFISYPIWFDELLQTLIKFIFFSGLLITLLRKNFDSPLMKLGVLMSFMLTGFFLEHYLFSTLFPISRTGVYFIPLYGFFIFYLFSQFIEGLRPTLRKVFMTTGLILIALPLTIHFFRTLNLKHTFEWKYDTHTKEVVRSLEARNEELVLAHNWIFGPAIRYYIQSRKLKIKAVKTDTSNYDQDFIYEFRDQMKAKDWPVDTVYNDTGTALYRHPGK